jgi:FMN phosphatase YigB (HAD superfamily)
VRTVPASDLDEPASDLPVLVLDFDGTVCLGDGPIWAYADALLPSLDGEHARRVSDGLTAFLAGNTDPGDFSDGYSAVVRLAGPGVARATLDAAYVASRRALSAGEVDVHSPDGLAELLAELAGGVRRVLLTNAPDIGMALLLDRLGLADVIDEVITSAGKPDGFDALLPQLLDGADPARLLSVGDMWVNDISRPLHTGCATAYVDRTGADPRPAHARATTHPGQYPAIRSWAADPHAFVEQYRPDVAESGASNPSPRS